MHRFVQRRHLYAAVQLKCLWLRKEDLAEAAQQAWQGHSRPAAVSDDLIASLSSAFWIVHCHGHICMLMHFLAHMETGKALESHNLERECITSGVSHTYSS